AIKTLYEMIFDISRNMQISAQNEDLDQAEAPRYFTQVTIVGLGLIGGTMARLIKKHLPTTKIIAVDREEVLAQAANLGLVDDGIADWKKAVKKSQKSQLIILAAAPAENIKLLNEIAPSLKRRQLVIDVSSTKAKIARQAEQVDLHGADFIGGHPFF